MADCAQAYNLAKEAGVLEAQVRNEAWYLALGWVLQESWQGNGE